VVFQSAREQALSTATIPRPFMHTSDTMLRWGPNRTQMVSIGSYRCWTTFPGVQAAAHVGPALTAPFVAEGRSPPTVGVVRLSPRQRGSVSSPDDEVCHFDVGHGIYLGLYGVHQLDLCLEKPHVKRLSYVR
jgi:hypothetical protein